jgi:peptidoglycan hydrolase-like protein with peptidoglycan-binding domain
MQPPRSPESSIPDSENTTNTNFSILGTTWAQFPGGIRRIQEILKSAGENPGVIDGREWKNTLNALIALQKKNNIPANEIGIIWTETMALLNQLNKEKPSNPIKITPKIQEKFAVAMQNYDKLPENIKWAINDLCREFGVPRELAMGICIQESKFISTARSVAWASWFMQLMPGTSAGIKKFINQPKNKYAWPEEKYFSSLRDNSEFMKYFRGGSDTENIALGIAYFSYLMQRNGGSVVASLRQYNGGTKPSNNQENLWYAPSVLALSGLVNQYAGMT